MNVYRLKILDRGNIPIRWLFQTIDKEELSIDFSEPLESEEDEYAVNSYTALDVTYDNDKHTLDCGRLRRHYLTFFTHKRDTPLTAVNFDSVEEIIDYHFTTHYNAKIEEIKVIWKRK